MRKSTKFSLLIGFCLFVQCSSDRTSIEVKLHAQMLKGKQLILAGHVREGEKLLIELCNTSGDVRLCRDIYSFLADYFFESSDFNTAIEYYMELLKVSKGDEQNQIAEKVALAFANQRNWNQVKMFLEKTIPQIKSPSGSLLLLFARACEETGDITQSIYTARKVVEGAYPDEDKIRAYFMLIRIYEAQEKLKKAIRVAEEAMKKGYYTDYMKRKIKILKRRLIERHYR